MRLVAVLQDTFNPFDSWFPGVECVVVSSPDEIVAHDVVIVWGGADIPPSLYGKTKSFMGGGREHVYGVDLTEWQCMLRAKELGCAIIGVCRGGQMLTALGGGYLIQHIDNHGGPNHDVECVDGTIINVNSYHHQMMVPPLDPDKAKLIGWTKGNRSKRYFDEDKLVTMHVEPELIHYPPIRGLAIQWHPEWMSNNCAATQYCKNYFMENIL